MKIEVTVIDGKNAILGRLASFIAKQALLGKKIVVVNCNEVVISGNPRSNIIDYIKTRQKGSANFKGPFFPKSPERIVKRTVRGMLSYRSTRGRKALDQIMCYNDTPQEFLETKKIVAGKEKKIKTLKLRDLSREI